MSSSATRTLHVLDQVAHSDRPPGVTEIARALSLPPASVFRSLDALLRADLVSRYRESSRYVAGPAAERLRRSVIGRFPMRELCLPYLRQLVSISGEAVSLHVRVGWYAVQICSLTGIGEVTGTPPLRQPHALAESCAGRIMLAFLPQHELAAYRHFGSGRAFAKAELKEIVAKAYAAGKTDQVDAGAISYPLRTKGHAIAAVTIEAPFLKRASGDQLGGCKQVMANIEGLAAAQPSLFVNIFAHIDPDSITF